MFKILPAVIFTAILATGTTVSFAQPRGYYPPYPQREVVIIDDHRDRDGRYDHDDRYDRHDHDCDYGCKHKQSHKKRKKYHRDAGYPLIIIQTRNLPIMRYGHNRYYYRNAAGMHYWLGRDGRLYLDVKYVRMARYNDHEYSQWQRGY